MAKWEVEFILTVDGVADQPNRNFTLTYGITNGKAIAETVFYHAKNNPYITGIRVRKVKNDREMEEDNAGGTADNY